MAADIKLTVKIIALILLTLLVSSTLSFVSNERIHEQYAVSAVVPSLISVKAILSKNYNQSDSQAEGGIIPAEESQSALLRAIQESEALLEEQTFFASKPYSSARTQTSDLLTATISITDSAGLLIAGIPPLLAGNTAPAIADMKLLQLAYPSEKLPDFRYLRDNDSVLFAFTLVKSADNTKARAFVEFTNSHITSGKTQRLIALQMAFLLAVLTGIVILLAVFFGLSHWTGRHRNREKKRLIWTLVMVLCAAQITLFGINWSATQTDLAEQIRLHAESDSSLVKNDIEAHLGSGFPDYANMLGDLAEHYASRSEYISHIDFSVPSGDHSDLVQQQAETTKDTLTLFTRLLISVFTKPLGETTEFNVVQNEALVATGKTMFAHEQINLQLTTSLLDSGIILLIALLISVELSVLVLTRWEKSRRKHGEEKGRYEARHKFKMMRPAIFLFLFGIDLSMSIIPLHMENLYLPEIGISEAMLTGLPISVEFLCVGIAILLSGVWLDRKGWVPPFTVGLVLTILGCLYSWVASNGVHFILSRALLGFGYGLTLLAAQGYVISHTSVRNKAQGLAHLFAGLYSGSICGAATGAMVAERFSYQWTFLLGAGIVSSVVIYGFFYLGFASKEQRVIPKVTDAAKNSAVSVWQFLAEKRVLVVVLLSSLPASVAAIGFLNYFTPVYLHQSGISEEKIGQVLMLFGICLATLGPVIARFADRAQSKKTPIIVGGFLGGIAFMSFDVLSGVAAVTFAVLVLGISNCLVLPSQSAYLLRLDITQSFGEGKAMGVFRATSRIGQMLGPLVFASLVGFVDIDSGVFWFGFIYILLAVLFFILAEREVPLNSQQATSRS